MKGSDQCLVHRNLRWNHTRRPSSPLDIQDNQTKHGPKRIRPRNASLVRHAWSTCNPHLPLLDGLDRLRESSPSPFPLPLYPFLFSNLPSSPVSASGPLSWPPSSSATASSASSWLPTCTSSTPTKSTPPPHCLSWLSRGIWWLEASLSWGFRFIRIWVHSGRWRSWAGLVWWWRRFRMFSISMDMWRGVGVDMLYCSKKRRVCKASSEYQDTSTVIYWLKTECRKITWGNWLGITPT